MQPAADELKIKTPMRIPIDKLRTSDRHFFGRDRLDHLAELLRTHGLVDPIVVKESGDGFEIVSGRRRWLAARLLGWRSIDAFVLAS